MQQNILSQVPASGSPQDVPGSRAGQSSRDPDTGKSRFDEVSRAEQQRMEHKRLEQKRLDQKQADRREEADRLQEKRAEQRAQESDNRRADEPRNDRKVDKKSSDKAAEKSDKTDKSEASKTDGKSTENAEKATEKKETASTDTETKDISAGAEIAVEDLDAAMPPVTFAMLQTMTGAANTASGAENAVAVNSQMTGKSFLQGMLNGQSNQPGQPAGSAGKVLPPGAQLTDLLSANVGSDTSRPIDAASLVSVPKFQTALDQATQSLQPGNLQAGKLTAENAVPLRSYATSVDVPVGQAEWGDKVMGKLSFLTARNMKEAEIHLTPPDMGPMEVKVRMHNEQAHVTVHAANPVVREQLELNSHRLRDMLGEQGVELGQFDVSSQSEQQTSEQGDEAGTGGSGQGGGALAQGDSDMDEVQASHLDLSWKGEVDLFA
ncbi:flagellar hook-length control protein FliK [Marinobacter nauticus]